MKKVYKNFSIIDLSKKEDRKLNKVFRNVPVLHSLLILLNSNMIFETPIYESGGLALFCYICAITIVFLMYYVFFKTLRNKQYQQVAVYAFIYVVPLFMLFSLISPFQYVGGDIDLYYNRAIQYDMNWDLYYLSSLCYIIPMMIVPLYISPAIFQLILISICVGYCVYRSVKFFGKKGKLLYLPFFLIPILYYSHFINRMPIYVTIYILVISILYFDYLENECLTRRRYFIIIFLVSILSRWRYEGIYLLFLTPLIISKVYKLGNRMKAVTGIFACILFGSIVINIPQAYGTTFKDYDYNIKRMSPFYDYTLPIMLYEGLDLEQNSEYWEDLNLRMDLDRVKEIVSERGSNIAEGLWAAWGGAVNENISNEEYREFTKTFNKLAIKNWQVFLKARCMAFFYTALNVVPYKAGDFNAKSYIQENYYLSGCQKTLVRFYTKENETIENANRNLYNRLLSGKMDSNSGTIKKWIYRFQWNLLLPLILGIIELIYCVIKREEILLMFLLGLSLHTLLVFILAPASYFHYYLLSYEAVYYIAMIMFLKNTRGSR